jgi:farnesyl diphosphate synthase
MAESLLVHWRARADARLAGLLEHPAPDAPQLGEAMRHAVLLGGKRMRPLLVYASGHALGLDDPEHLDAPAAAVELVHAYSLIHDDLPAMDDDILRRGQATVHVAFGEATAILAGDALQALAFTTLAEAALPAGSRLRMIATLADAAGARGMVAGQSLDMAASAVALPVEALPVEALERLHALKTGALIRAAVRLGALAAEADAAQCLALDRFAGALGLAFQIRDDLLDIEADADTLGKTPGKDSAQGKATFPALLGVEASRARLDTLAATMHAALAGFGERAGALAALGELAIRRVR